MSNPLTRLVRALMGAGPRRQTVTWEWREPPHPRREDDPWYRLFEAEKRRRKREGGYVCARCGSGMKVELHHLIPYALQGGIDIAKLNRAKRLTLDATSFPAWYHGVANTQPLCDPCHTLVHAIPAPAWMAMEVWQDSVPAPVRLLSKGEV